MARGLLDDDTVWVRTIEDASLYQVPNQPRHLFVIIFSILLILT